MFTNFEAEWFQAFRRAVLESEPDLAYSYAEDALTIIGERLRDPDTGEAERQAMNGAIRSLNLIRRTDFSVAA
jgi:hypothetical protein